MAFSECRMRLTALEVNSSIWLSNKGWTTSDSRNTFFLPLAPDILHEITQGRNQTSDIRHHGVSLSVVCYWSSLGLCCRKDGLGEPFDRDRCRLLRLFCVTSHHRDRLSHCNSWEFTLDELVFRTKLILVAFLSACIVSSGFALLQS